MRFRRNDDCSFLFQMIPCLMIVSLKIFGNDFKTKKLFVVGIPSTVNEASASMQSLLASSLVYGAGKSRSVRVSHLVPANKYRHMVVRSMAENGLEEQPSSTIPEASKIPPPPPTPTPFPPRPKKVSTKFSNVFAFSGPARERINGILAMVGFVSALAVELSKGQDVFSQISNGGVSLFLGTSILLSVASVIPFSKESAWNPNQIGS